MWCLCYVEIREGLFWMIFYTSVLSPVWSNKSDSQWVSRQHAGSAIPSSLFISNMPRHTSCSPPMLDIQTSCPGYRALSWELTSDYCCWTVLEFLVRIIDNERPSSPRSRPLVNINKISQKTSNSILMVTANYFLILSSHWQLSQPRASVLRPQNIHCGLISSRCQAVANQLIWFSLVCLYSSQSLSHQY